MKTMSMAVVMNKTSTVIMDDRRSSATRCTPAPPRDVRVRVNSSSVARAEYTDRGGKRPVCRDERFPMSTTKRRREVDHGRYDDYAYRESKKKHAANEPAERASSNRTRPTARASREKEENNASAGTAPRREIKNHKDGAGGRRSQERAPIISRPRVPAPSPALAPTLVALPDSLTVQDALSAAIARARPVRHMRREVLLLREEARRELAKMVRTVEFNDPYISPMDALKP